MSLDLTTTIARLRNAGDRLRAMPVAAIAAALERVAHRWQDRTAPERRIALAELPQRVPFGRPVCERALDALFEPLTAPRLLALLDDLLGTHQALDAFVPLVRHTSSILPSESASVRRKAFGADVALLILAGNIIGVGIWDIAFCLLCKTPVLVKPSSDEPLLPALFAQSLAAAAPELADAVASLPPDVRLEVWDGIDAVIVYGTDETVTAVKRCAPAKMRVIERGHRFSVAIVDAAYADERTAQLLALDIARFDQRGCLSPQVCFVVGRAATAAFGHKVAEALQRLNAELPPVLRDSERARVTHFRLTCQMLGAQVLAPSDASWTVAVWDAPTMRDAWQKVACSARVVHIVAMDALDAVFDALRPLGQFLQGVAVAMDETMAERTAEALGHMGASRVCPVGRLQTPPLEWSQDGKHLIAELVRWCDLEPLALPAPEGGWVPVFEGDAERTALARFMLEQQGIPVSVEVDFDPSDPTQPRQRLCVPAEHAADAQRVFAQLPDR